MLSYTGWQTYGVKSPLVKNVVNNAVGFTVLAQADMRVRG